MLGWLYSPDAAQWLTVAIIAFLALIVYGRLADQKPPPQSN